MASSLHPYHWTLGKSTWQWTTRVCVGRDINGNIWFIIASSMLVSQQAVEVLCTLHILHVHFLCSVREHKEHSDPTQKLYPQPVRMCCRELHIGWICWLTRALTLVLIKVQGELVHIARGNRCIGQPHFPLKGHVEFWAQTNSIEGDRVGVLLHSIPKVEDLQCGRMEVTILVCADTVPNHL